MLVAGDNISNLNISNPAISDNYSNNNIVLIIAIIIVRELD